MKYLEILRNCKGKRIAFDIDQTITIDEPVDWLNINEEERRKLILSCKPHKPMIDLLNELSMNNLVYLFSSRSDLYQCETHQWLKRNGVSGKFFILNKPTFDWFIDDKAINAIELQKELDDERK